MILSLAQKCYRVLDLPTHRKYMEAVFLELQLVCIKRNRNKLLHDLVFQFSRATLQWDSSENRVSDLFCRYGPHRLNPLQAAYLLLGSPQASEPRPCRYALGFRERGLAELPSNGWSRGVWVNTLVIGKKTISMPLPIKISYNVTNPTDQWREIACNKYGEKERGTFRYIWDLNFYE